MVRKHLSQILDGISVFALRFLLLDSVLLAAAFPLAVLIRLESIDLFSDPSYFLPVAAATGLGVGFLMAKKTYSSEHQNFGSEVAFGVLTAVSMSASVLPVIDFFLSLNTPRSIPILYWLISLTFLAGWRLAGRLYLQRVRTSKSRIKAVVCGVDESARQFVRYLIARDEAAVSAVVDLSESQSLVAVTGIPIIRRNKFEDFLSNDTVDVVLCVGPEIETSSLVSHFSGLSDVMVRHVPSVDEMLLNGISSNDDRDQFSLDKLLGRSELITRFVSHEYLRNKVILVTGGGGSIGSELVLQILNHNPARLVIFDSSEFALYRMSEALFGNSKIRFVLGSVVSINDLRSVFLEENVDIVFHAAAYKHVPLVEANPLAAVSNNVFGTRNCVHLAREFDIERFILISTDKAVRPTNIMGCTKRICELIVSDAARFSIKTMFGAVRFGNVLDSSGSVIPKFRQQIAVGGPVTVTHPDVERFFMTIPEAVGLVLDAAALLELGKTEVFVLDMGKMVKIAELAKSCIELSGYRMVDCLSNNPEEIQVIYTGLRPGEKMFEELHVGAGLGATSVDKIFFESIDSQTLSKLDKLMSDLEQVVESGDPEACLDVLLAGDLGYGKPSNELTE